MEFSQLLNELMENQYITRYQLAKKLGVHPSTVTNWLNGATPRRSIFPDIADALGVEVYELMGIPKAKPVAPDSGMTKEPGVKAVITKSHVFIEGSPEYEAADIYKSLMATDSNDEAISILASLTEREKKLVLDFARLLKEERQKKDGDTP